MIMTDDGHKVAKQFCCATCDYHTGKKNHYERHLETVKHIKMTNRVNNGQTGKKYLCEDCGKSYKYRQGLSFHRKTCTGNVHINTYHEEKEMKRDQEIEELRSQIAFLMETRGTTTNNNTTNNNTQNNTQNIYITVNNFGKENIEYITDKDICRLISMAPSKTIPNIIQMIHFDPEHPENHNVKMTNKKLKYAQVFTDNGWVTTSRGKAVDDMIQTGYNVAAQKYSDNKDKIKSSKQGQFENFQMRFEDQDAETMRTLKSDVDLSLINGTDKIHKKAAIEDTE